MALSVYLFVLIVTARLSSEASEHKGPAANATCTQVTGEESYTCEGLGLNEIPGNLPPAVKHLDFSFNILFAIYQSTFSSLENLKHLDLTRCRINWIYEDAFQNNPHLNTLVLIGNPLMYVADTAFNGALSLKHLFLTQTGLNSLTLLSRHTLDSVETLYLGSNHISSIKLPDSFPIYGLKYLDLQLNGIRTISATDVNILKKATNLSLNLKGNDITYIEPTSFMSSIFYSLDFAGCTRLVDISVILAGLIGINTHSLRIGSFEDIDDDADIAPYMLKGLYNITVADINLQNVHFSPMSSSTFQYLTNIKKLDLTNTGLKVLPSGISKNNLLTDLTLNKNSFENACDIKLGSFPSLTRLCIKGNCNFLNLGSGCFENLSKLQHLDLSHSDVTTSDCCSAQLKGLGSLKHLNLSHNNEHTLQDLAFQDNVNLELLDFSHTQLHIKASESPFHNLRFLRVLNLSNSQTNMSNQHLLTGLESLVLLNLKENVFPSGIIRNDNLFQQVLNLEILIISSCELIAIDSEAFHALKKLRYVYLDHNKLTVFSSSAFYDLSQIHLNFAHNNITIIPKKMLIGITGDNVINLSYNPMDCTCANIEFLTWLQQNMDTMENLNETFCGTPEALAGTSLKMVTLSCGVSVAVIVLIVLLIFLLIVSSVLVIHYFKKRRYLAI